VIIEINRKGSANHITAAIALNKADTADLAWLYLINCRPDFLLVGTVSFGDGA
jgi:hypothetical protein